MATKKSKVWEFFNIHCKNASCKICKEDVAASGGTTNLSLHLLRQHKRNRMTEITMSQSPKSGGDKETASERFGKFNF